MEIVLPLLRGAVGGISGLGGLWEDYVRLRYDKEEHERLKSRVEDYQRTVLVYQEQIRRLNRLKVLDHVKGRPEPTRRFGQSDWRRRSHGV